MNIFIFELITAKKWSTMVVLMFFPNFPVGHVDGMWGPWKDWSECTKTCGGGKFERRRECDSPRPSHGGKHCQGHATQSRDCGKDKCKLFCFVFFFLISLLGHVDGSWGNWESWSQCTRTCGGGKTKRTRECDSGGRDCEGHATQTRDCNLDTCKFILYNCILSRGYIFHMMSEALKTLLVVGPDYTKVLILTYFPP